MSKNKHGLPRTINASTKRIVRQRCGFGCVICGCAIIDYHHFNPQFCDALLHDPNGITLLCGNCHKRVHKKITSSEEVREANNAPFCKRVGFTRDIFFKGLNFVPVKLGQSRIRAATILRYDDEVIMGFSPPEFPKGPIKINAKFTDDKGEPSLSIIDNEWQAGANHYDICTSGSTLIVKNNKINIVLKMELSTSHEIQINALKMSFRGFYIEANDEWLSIRNPKGGILKYSGTLCRDINDIGVWMHSDGGAEIATNEFGSAACRMAP
jgi:hypothetical protein